MRKERDRQRPSNRLINRPISRLINRPINKPIKKLTNRPAQAVLAVLGAFWLTAAGTFPAAAAPVKSVKIHLTAEEFDEDGRPVLEAFYSSENTR